VITGTARVARSFFQSELNMAPRAYWKGYLKLSLVSCPVALYPAPSEKGLASIALGRIRILSHRPRQNQIVRAAPSTAAR
jgi:non-homologous end joining protein Ku